MLPIILLQPGVGSPEPPPPPPPQVDSFMNFTQLAQRFYDPSVNSMRTTPLGAPGPSYGTNMDSQQVLNACYKADTQTLRTVLVTSEIAAPINIRNWEQAIRWAFDPTNNALRVTELGANSSVRFASFEQCLTIAWSPIHAAFRVTTPSTPGPAVITTWGFEELVMSFFDEPTGKFRVCA